MSHLFGLLMGTVAKCIEIYYSSLRHLLQYFVIFRLKKTEMKIN